MDECPEHPADKAAKVPSAKVVNRGAAGDDGSVAAVVEVERRQRRASQDVGAERLTEMLALLLGHLRQRRQRLAVRSIDRCRVADGVDALMIGHG